MKSAAIIILLVLLIPIRVQAWQIESGDSTYNDEIESVYDFSNPGRIAEALAPLASLSISPYFGFFTASGISILAQNDIINAPPFLKNNRIIGNYYALTIFFLLTVLTTFSSFFSTIKIAGVIISYLEDKSSLLIASLLYVIPFIIGSTDIAETVQSAQPLHAGFTDMNPWLLFAAGVVNLYIIQTTRFALDVLTFITPVPLLDKVFEIAKMAFSAFMVLLYILNPWIPFVILICMFIFCALIYKIIRVRNVYFINMYIKPFLLMKIFNRQYPLKDVSQTMLLSKFDHVSMCVPAFPKFKIGSIKKLHKCWLIGDGEELYLCKKRFLREPLIEQIYPREGSPFAIYEFLFEIKLWQLDKKDACAIAIRKDCKAALEFLLTYYPFDNPESAGAKKAWRNAADFWKALIGESEELPEVRRLE